MSKLALAAATLIFVTACAAEQPAKKERERKPRKTRPKAQKAQPPQPSSEPRPPAPDPPEPPAVVAPSQWWCLCYQREGPEGPEPMTACRELESQCRKLEGRVTKGSKEIIAGSLTFGCRPLSGQHPSDVAGTHEQWQASKLAGAWVSEGVCQLQASPAAEPESEAEQPEPEPSDPFAFMRSEIIGDLNLSASSAKVRFALGQPQSEGSIDEVAATGDFEQVWTYAEGLTLVMSSTTRSGPQQIGAVIIVAPSPLKTRRGVGLGDERGAVERAYGDVQAPADERGDETSFIAGSVYGGLIFAFEDGVVSRIFLGAAAE